MTNIAIALVLFAMASTVFSFEIAPGVNLACMVIGTLIAFAEGKRLSKEQVELEASVSQLRTDIRKLKGE